jgi:hypothetical protein
MRCTVGTLLGSEMFNSETTYPPIIVKTQFLILGGTNTLKLSWRTVSWNRTAKNSQLLPRAI